jgi:hypothetical protein
VRRVVRVFVCSCVRVRVRVCVCMVWSSKEVSNFLEKWEFSREEGNLTEI